MADLDIVKKAVQAAEQCNLRIYQVSQALTAIGQLAERSMGEPDPHLQSEEVSCLFSVLAHVALKAHEELEVSLSAIAGGARA